ANVGRAYYDWRYAGQQPAPAVAAEVVRDSLYLRGWGWPSSSTVQAQLYGAETTPLVDLKDLTTDETGHFSASVAVSADLSVAVAGAVPLRATARAGDLVAAVPVAPVAASGATQVEGILAVASN